MKIVLFSNIRSQKRVWFVIREGRKIWRVRRNSMKTHHHVLNKVNSYIYISYFFWWLFCVSKWVAITIYFIHSSSSSKGCQCCCFHCGCFAGFRLPLPRPCERVRHWIHNYRAVRNIFRSCFKWFERKNIKTCSQHRQD